MKLHLKDIVSVVGGTFIGPSSDIVVTSVEFDTRNVTEGSLYVPLQGARDGHDFIPQAQQAGAVLTFSSRRLEGETLPYILVADPLLAMQQLAQYYTQVVGPKVIGITGSNGKTTTKDMVAAVLSTSYVTYKTQGNYNNQIGMPYTMLSMPDTTEMLVLEMGMDRKGEIAALSQLAQPDVAAITMIGESHLEHLGSRQGIAHAKMEIVSGLAKNGLLIVPSDEPLIEEAVSHVKQEVETFGFDETASFKGQVVSESKEQTQFETDKHEGTVFGIPVLGRYNVKNALMALLIGSYFNVPVTNMKAGLQTFQLTANRTQWLTTKTGISILSDVYNANPTAMTLVLDSFSGLSLPGSKVIVLGDMLELGEGSQKMHEGIAPHIQGANFNKVFLYGKEMKALYDVLHDKIPENTLYYYPLNEKDSLKKDLAEQLNPKDTVFLKGSNGTGLIEIVDYLLK